MEESIYTAKTMEISTLNADPYEHLALVDQIIRDATTRSESGNSGNSSSSSVAPDPPDNLGSRQEPPKGGKAEKELSL